MWRLIFLSLMFSLIEIKSSSIPIKSTNEELLDTNNNDEKPMTLFRLKDTISPNSYDIKLIPNLGQKNFSGIVIIEITANTNTTQITVHSLDLEISVVEVTGSMGMNVPIDKYYYEKHNQVVIIDLKEELTAGFKYRLRFLYTGKLQDDMHGFYYSQYKENNEVKLLAATQFESTHARKAFPCFDEPKFKTPFTISIARFDKERAISNMNSISVGPPDPAVGGKRWETFEKTPDMPTYLVAFIISELESSVSTDQKFRVWTRPSYKGQTDYVLTWGPVLLRTFDDTLKVPYSLPKMDVAAIPDFAAGAMENWGLTTYRERLSLYEPGLQSTRQKELVTMVIAHEFAHQWFGDLVTPVWWDYTWLNEAFATFFEYFIEDEISVLSELKLSDKFIVEELQPALYNDERSVHHAMTSITKTPEEISSQFDCIIYNKGASVLRMFMNLIGKETFYKALTRYLKAGIANKGSVEPKLLFDAFHAEMNEASITVGSSYNIEVIMRSWTDQSGYPLVTATRNYTSGDVKLTQSAYKTEKSTKGLENQLWKIPITYTSHCQTSHAKVKVSKAWIVDKEGINLNVTASRGWLLVNYDQNGFYRVNYDSFNWKLLEKQLFDNCSIIPLKNRAQIIDDSFVLAQDNIISYEIPFSIVKYLPNENELVPWFSALENFDRLFATYRGTQLAENTLKDFVLNLITPIYEKIKFKQDPKDDHNVQIARSSLVKWACNLGYQKCEESAVSDFKRFLKDGDLKVVNPDVQATVLCTGLRKGTYEDWSKVWDYFTRTELYSEREVILQSLGCTKDKKALNEYLEKLFLTESPIRKQNERYVLYSIFSWKEGVDTAIEFLSKKITDPEVQKNKKEIIKILISKLGNAITIKEQISAFEKVMKSGVPVKEFNQGLTKAYENSKSANEKREKNYKLIEDVLKLSLSSSPSSSVTIMVPSMMIIISLFITIKINF